MMANNSYTWDREFRVSAMNANSSEYVEGVRGGLRDDSLAFAKSLQTFPTWITDIIFTSIDASGVLTNVVLLAYIIYYKRYKTPVFCVILSLGMADLGVCLAGLLYYNFVSPYIQGPLWLCPLAVAMLHSSYLSSTYHIACFAVLRFLQLVYPLASRAKVTTGLMLKICLTIWIINFMQGYIITFYNEKAHNMSASRSSTMYVCVYMGNRQARSIWRIIYWVAIPFISTSVLHVVKHVMLILSRSATVASLDDQVQQARRKTDSRALAVVIAVYFLSVTPYLVQTFRIYLFSVSDNQIEVYLVLIFLHVAYSSSAINPWVYLFAAETVRSEIRKMLTCNRET